MHCDSNNHGCSQGSNGHWFRYVRTVFTRMWCRSRKQLACVLILDILTAAGGVAGGMRMGISAILSAVYTAILSSRLAETIPAQVPSALVQAGLPKSSVTGFLTAVTSGSAKAMEAVQGISPAIITAGTAAYKEASSSAYRTVFLSTIAIKYFHPLHGV